MKSRSKESQRDLDRVLIKCQVCGCPYKRENNWLLIDIGKGICPNCREDETIIIDPDGNATKLGFPGEINVKRDPDGVY